MFCGAAATLVGKLSAELRTVVFSGKADVTGKVMCLMIPDRPLKIAQRSKLSPCE
jgi:hypothetical protein